MKNFPMFCVAVLLGAAVSAQTKVSFEGRIGRAVRGSVVVSHHDRHDSRPRCEPVLRLPAPPRGHWETVYEEVLVPGYWTEERVPPTYGWIYESCGHRRWGIVDAGGCRRVWVPARYETRAKQVWVAC